MIRLHKHAAVLVAADEEALDELIGAGDAFPGLGPRLAPTVAWIDHQRRPRLCEALRRAGYTPRETSDE